MLVPLLAARLRAFVTVADHIRNLTEVLLETAYKSSAASWHPNPLKAAPSFILLPIHPVPNLHKSPPRTTTLVMLSFLSLLLIPAVLAHNITHPDNSKRGGKRFTNYYAGENASVPKKNLRPSLR
jgi:hypothetical protein